MAEVTFQGAPVKVSGKFPQPGSKAPAFSLCAADLNDISLEDFQGKTLVLNIFPSIDTPVCATSVRKFNEKVASLNNTIVLCVSADLPFATGRFCAAEDIENVKTGSFFRSPGFTEHYGVNIAEGGLRGLAARAVIIIDAQGNVTYSELVPEIAEEPNYELALSAVKELM
ncbi:thiol peroxidase [Endozoicomonas atrinae]|uniref:thiol peroxidase n=1 Tax=Endozoicomonas atrinae TaxID=1333660 RepID=UPI00082719D2|nr:thiol peroxidase [Endozoicomonas atrinae]